MAAFPGCAQPAETTLPLEVPPVTAGQGEGGVERGVEREREGLERQDVPGPAAEVVEQAGARGLGAQVAVVGAEEEVGARGGGGEELGPEPGPPDGAGPGVKAQAESERKDRDHDARVQPEKGEESRVGEVRRQVGGEESLDGAREPPVISQLVRLPAARHE